MVRRPLTARFMPGVWVFPGGKVDVEDADAPFGFGGNRTDSDWKVAALRELIEETGLWLTTDGTVSRRVDGDVFDAVTSAGVSLVPEALTYISNWITPKPLPLRFDTRFFLGVADGDAVARVDGNELIDVEWLSPVEALHRDDSDEWEIAFPTRKMLQMLAAETTVEALVNRFQSLNIVAPVQPRLAVQDGEIKILLPDDDGFDTAASAQGDDELLTKLLDVAARGGDDVPAEFRTTP